MIADADPPASYTPASRVRRPPRGFRRRRGLPGWIFLVLIVLGFYLLISRSWSYNSQDVTIDAWSCRATPVQESAVSPGGAGCSAQDVGGEIALFHRSSPLEPGFGPDPMTVPAVDVDSIELNIQVRLDDPATSIVLVDASADPPVPGVALSSDAAGLQWNAPFRAEGSAEFVLLVGPRPGAE